MSSDYVWFADAATLLIVVLPMLMTMILILGKGD